MIPLFQINFVVFSTYYPIFSSNTVQFTIIHHTFLQVTNLDFITASTQQLNMLHYTIHKHSSLFLTKQLFTNNTTN